MRDQINSAIHVIVQIDRYADGRRRVAEVAAVASQRRERFRLATLARFEAEPLKADRRVVGSTRHFPLPPTIGRWVELAGERVPDVFLAATAEAPIREAT